MKVTRTLATVDTTKKMTVAFDVSKHKVNYYSEARGKLSGTSCRDMEVVQGEVRNSHGSLCKLLGELAAYAAQHGYESLHIVCEPTGHYSDVLLRSSRQLGYTTGLVSGENVSKARVLENNDSSRDDIKDPRVIYMLATMGKEQRYRVLPPLYQALRELNRIYDSADEWRTQKRCELSDLIERLFCDYQRSREFFLGVTGKALMQAYGFNPYRIVKHSYKQFCRRMRTYSPRAYTATLEDLYQTAQTSVLNAQAPEHVAILEQRLGYIWEDFWTAHRRRENIRSQIAQHCEQLCRQGAMAPQADGKLWTPYRTGRLLGEIGPVADFASWPMLQRYAGLNLRTRESGTYKGRMKLSKKGRIPLRHVSGKIAFALVRRDQLYGPYFHQMRAQKRSGTWALANVQRKMLRMFFALARRREQFSEQRFDLCESQYRTAA